MQTTNTPSPSKPMAAGDEDAFMSQLLQGLDDSFWSAVPSPDPSPIKQKKPSCIPEATPSTPTKSRQPAQTKQILSSTVFSADDHDITTFLEGSENWDLDADPFSPIKPSSSKTARAQVKLLHFITLF